MQGRRRTKADDVERFPIEHFTHVRIHSEERLAFTGECRPGGIGIAHRDEIKVFGQPFVVSEMRPDSRAADSLVEQQPYLPEADDRCALGSRLFVHEALTIWRISRMDRVTAPMFLRLASLSVTAEGKLSPRGAKLSATGKHASTAYREKAGMLWSG